MRVKELTDEIDDTPVQDEDEVTGRAFGGSGGGEEE